MPAWDIIRHIRRTNPDFFAKCTDENVLSNEEEYKEIPIIEMEDDFGKSEDGIFPSDIFPNDMSKYDFPSIDYERISRKVSDLGIEALAWYRSFHWDPPEKWGIYIPVSSIYYLARNLDPNPDPSKFLHLVSRSYKVIVMHEYFHYIVDMAAAVLESAESFKKNLYAPYSLNKRSTPEESVANAWTLSRSLSPYHRQVKRFMDSQPYPYTEFRDYRGARLADGLRRIANLLVTGTGGNAEPIEYIFKLNEKRKSNVPIYILPTDTIPNDSPYFLGFAPIFAQNCIKRSDKFEKNLRKLRIPFIEKMLDNALNTLTHGSSTGGLRFKKMKGHNDRYEFRLNQGLRVTARYLQTPSNEGCTSELILEDIGKHKIL